MQKLTGFLMAAALLAGAASTPHAGEGDHGRQLLEARCGRCHAVTADAKSKLPNAPNLRETLRAYPADRLEFELAEGIGSRHPAMPQIQFTSDEIASVTAYLSAD